MPRYIDADLMTADIQRYLCACCSIHCNPSSFKNSACEIAECLRMIDNAPTADVEPVRHGHWEWESGYVGTEARCSVCKRSPMGFYSLPKSQIGRLPEYPFCPKCGAKMDGGEQE